MNKIIHQTIVGNNKLQLIKEYDLFYILRFTGKKSVAMTYAGMPSYNEAVERYRKQVTLIIGR